MKSDSELQHDVLDELAFEPMVDHAHIGVAARNGVVTLTGFVPNYTQKFAAERAAARVEGVQAIAEDIEVRFASDPKTSDAEIAERIVQILQWDVRVPHEGIGVRVEHGWVTLEGQVEWHFQKLAAASAASRISGVRGVTNLVTVTAKLSPTDVRERIKAAIKRQGGLDADAIEIAVEGQTVRLSGEVLGWNERKVAEKAAWSIPGVTRVEDGIVFA